MTVPPIGPLHAIYDSIGKKLEIKDSSGKVHVVYNVSKDDAEKNWSPDANEIIVIERLAQKLISENIIPNQKSISVTWPVKQTDQIDKVSNAFIHCMYGDKKETKDIDMGYDQWDTANQDPIIYPDQVRKQKVDVVDTTPVDPAFVTKTKKDLLTSVVGKIVTKNIPLFQTPKILTDSASVDDISKFKEDTIKNLFNALNQLPATHKDYFVEGIKLPRGPDLKITDVEHVFNRITSAIASKIDFKKSVKVDAFGSGYEVKRNAVKNSDEYQNPQCHLNSQLSLLRKKPDGNDTVQFSQVMADFLIVDEKSKGKTYDKSYSKTQEAFDVMSVNDATETFFALSDGEKEKVIDETQTLYVRPFYIGISNNIKLPDQSKIFESSKKVINSKSQVKISVGDNQDITAVYEPQIFYCDMACSQEGLKMMKDNNLLVLRSIGDELIGTLQNVIDENHALHHSEHRDLLNLMATFQNMIKSSPINNDTVTDQARKVFFDDMDLLLTKLIAEHENSSDEVEGLRPLTKYLIRLALNSKVIFENKNIGKLKPSEIIEYSARVAKLKFDLGSLVRSYSCSSTNYTLFFDAAIKALYSEGNDSQNPSFDQRQDAFLKAYEDKDIYEKIVAPISDVLLKL
ncbi:MAG: hypothetical protein JHC93_00665 [Parachlamydiales bacterium]|nr:hypothetical protein [Parachlamydiales bacterium]